MNDDIRRQKSQWQRRRPPGGSNMAGPGRRPEQRSGSSQRSHNPSASAQKNYERYIALAREAALHGDTIEMENCYQHAEHYFRVMRERTTT
jgi:hypothetical protein